MQGSWNNAQPYYRCTYPSEYARTNHVQHPASVYLREAEIAPALNTWLGTAVRPGTSVGPRSTLSPLPRKTEVSPEVVGLREEITGYGRQLGQYRAALDSGGDPAVVGQWISETQARKLAADARLRALTGTRAAPQRIEQQEITAVVGTIGGLMDALTGATAADKPRSTPHWACI